MNENDSAIIEAARVTLVDWMVGDARRAIAGHALVGALILGVCAIDTLGTLWAGSDADGDTFKNFARDYLPRGSEYEDRVYWGMRNRLVHNYSSFGFVYVDRRPDLHLTKDKGLDLQVINVESFISEVEQAAQDYVDDLYESQDLLTKFIGRTKEEDYALLGPVVFKSIEITGSSYPPATGGP